MAKYKWICNDPQKGGNTWRARNAKSCPKCGSEDIQVIAASPLIWPWILALFLIVLLTFSWVNRCSILPSMCDSVDSITNKENKEKKAPELTDRQIDVIELSKKWCKTFEIENELLQMEKYYDWNGEYENEKEYFLLEKELDIANEDFDNYNDLFGKRYEYEDDLEKATEDFNIIKKECEKCKEAIENIIGWDNFISSMEKELNSFEEEVDYRWSYEDRTKFLDDCNSDGELGESEFCSCVLNVLMSRYETPIDYFTNYTEDDIREIRETCAYILDKE